MALTVEVKTTAVEPSGGTEIVGVRSIKTEIVDGRLEVTASIEIKTNVDSDETGD